MKRRRLFVVLVVLLGTVLAARSFQPGAGAPRTGAVKVLDGDTVLMEVGGRAERVRLIGIDAPEAAQAPWGGRATSHLKKIISSAGGRVRLERGAEKKDRYGRLLGYLWTEDGRLVNLQMVKDGYAFALAIAPNTKFKDAFLEAERLALKEGIGILAEIKERPGDYKIRTSRDKTGN